MSVPELERVLERMKRSGFRCGSRRRPPAGAAAQYPEAKKVRASGCSSTSSAR